jgi:hypothetical protein
MHHLGFRLPECGLAMFLLVPMNGAYLSKVKLRQSCGKTLVIWLLCIGSLAVLMPQVADGPGRLLRPKDRSSLPKLYQAFARVLHGAGTMTLVKWP